MPFLERKQQTLVKEKCLESVTATACVVNLGLLYIDQIAKPDTQLKLIPFQLNKPLKLRLRNFSVVNFPLKLLHLRPSLHT